MNSKTASICREMNKAVFIVASLFVLALVFASQTVWPTYQVHRQSQAAIEVCGEGNVSRVDTKKFECKPQDGAE